jgi:hypothetical protein
MAVISAACMLECGLTASVCHAPTWLVTRGWTTFLPNGFDFFFHCGNSV